MSYVMSLGHPASTAMPRPTMYLRTLLHVALLSGLAHAFSGGWTSFAHNTRQQQHRHHTSAASAAYCAVVAGASETSSWARRRAGSFADATIRWSWGLQLRPPVAPRYQLRLMPNEYEAFFNKASKLGADATRGLAPEERAQRALEAS